MNDTDREATLARLKEFVDQQRGAEDLADQGSLDRAADVMALYDDRDEHGQRRWATELEPPKVARNRGQPVDPESFSRFTKWLAERVPVRGSTAYQLRDAYELQANYFRQAEIKPTGERELRPLKWLTRHDYADHVPEVWRIACELAGGDVPNSPTVRRALAQWKRDNLPKTERASTPRGAIAVVDRWINDAHRIMEQYPELFIEAINRVEVDAEQHFKKAA